MLWTRPRKIISHQLPKDLSSPRSHLWPLTGSSGAAVRLSRAISNTTCLLKSSAVGSVRLIGAASFWSAVIAASYERSRSRTWSSKCASSSGSLCKTSHPGRRTGRSLSKSASWDTLMSKLMKRVNQIKCRQDVSQSIQWNRQSKRRKELITSAWTLNKPSKISVSVSSSHTVAIYLDWARLTSEMNHPSTAVSSRRTREAWMTALQAS